jgi:hypothetical protein
MTDNESVLRADEASRLLKNPLYKEAWASYEAVLLELLASANTAPEKALEVRGWLIAARKARGHLERIVSEGTLAAESIRLAEQRKTVRQYVRGVFP